MSKSTPTEDDVFEALAILKSRGDLSKVPPEFIEALQTGKKQVSWPIDERGFFKKNDGKLFEVRGDGVIPFIESKARFLLLRGPRGSGKSVSGIQKGLRKIREGEPGAVVSPNFENFKTSTWAEWREWIPWELVVPEQQHRQHPEWVPNQPFQLVFDIGWKKVAVIFKGLRDENSARGPNINWVHYDEGGYDETGMAWMIMIAAVRIGNNPQAWCTTTPKGKDHWIYSFFIEQDLPEEVTNLLEDIGYDGNLIEEHFADLEENKKNLDPLFLASLLAAYPAGWLREQEVHGEFVEEGGVLGDPAWFAGKTLSTTPENVRKRCRYWDLAATEAKISRGKKKNDPDETVGTKMSFIPHKDRDNEFCIEDQHSGHWKWEDLLKEIVKTARKDGPSVKIVVEQEPGAGGKNQVAAVANFIQEQLPGWPQVEGHNPREHGDKIMRANEWFAEAARGQIYLLNGPWIKEFFKQLSSFPIGRHDDKIDSVSGARLYLAPISKWKKIGFLSLGGKR